MLTHENNKQQQTFTIECLFMFIYFAVGSYYGNEWFKITRNGETHSMQHTYGAFERTRHVLQCILYILKILHEHN